mmetsp:Transcript_28536/g.47232  ORF Transcript_28536/g.47232 Transcript_28536/m.47232 type:complete len:161 (+) Transcript_28536:2388-2870(+)
MKTMAEPTRAIGAMDGGMDMAERRLPMAIRTKENIGSTSDTDVESTAGPTVGFMMENLARISDTGREPFSGQMVQHMKETFIKDNEKGTDDTHFRMEDTIQEVGSMDDMKVLENATGKTVASTRVNGELGWLMGKVSRRTLMDASAMMVSGSMTSPFVNN